MMICGDAHHILPLLLHATSSSLTHQIFAFQPEPTLATSGMFSIHLFAIAFGSTEIRVPHSQDVRSVTGRRLWSALYTSSLPALNLPFLRTCIGCNGRGAYSRALDCKPHHALSVLDLFDVQPGFPLGVPQACTSKRFPFSVSRFARSGQPFQLLKSSISTRANNICGLESFA